MDEQPRKKARFDLEKNTDSPVEPVSGQGAGPPVGILVNKGEVTHIDPSMDRGAIGGDERDSEEIRRARKGKGRMVDPSLAGNVGTGDDKDEGPDITEETRAYEEELDRQEIGHTGDDDVEIMPFNLKQERSSGYFTQDGMYVDTSKSKGDDEEDSDPWLNQVDEVAKAEGAAQGKKKVKLIADDTGEDDGTGDTGEAADEGPAMTTREANQARAEYISTLLALLQPGETVVRAIQRLRPSQAGKGRRPNRVNRSKAKAKTLTGDVARARGERSKMDTSEGNDKVDIVKDCVASATVGTEDDDDNALEAAFQQGTAGQETRSDFERLTDAADKLMALGYYDVYNDTLEKIQAKLDAGRGRGRGKGKGNGNGSGSGRNGSTGASPAGRTDPPSNWHYRFTSSDNDEVYGPFSSIVMQGWVEQGFFTERPVWCRRVGGDGQWIKVDQIDFTNS